MRRSKYLAPIRSLKVLERYIHDLSNLMDKKRFTPLQRRDFKLLVWQIERYESKLFSNNPRTPLSMIEVTK